MYFQRIIKVSIYVIFIGIIYIAYKEFSKPNEETVAKTETSQNTVTKSACVPTFADGGGPYYKPNSPFRERIAPEQHNGEVLIVKGKILKNDCKTPIPNAVLDIWQANETGDYEDEWYRGQVRTDSEGNYRFFSVVPKGYGEGTGYRPPHIHFKVFVDNVEIITSQMFFPEVKGTPGFEDAYIMKISRDPDSINGIHNIILP